MADNITYQNDYPATPPSGTVVAADHVGDVDFQRIKIVTGADGVVDGDVSETNPMPVVNGVSKDMEGGGKVSVGVVAVEVTFTGTPKAIIISAPLDNTGTLYIGKSTVTSAGLNAFAYLEAGESLSIEYDDTTNAIYVVASIAAQNFFKGALL